MLAMTKEFQDLELRHIRARKERNAGKKSTETTRGREEQRHTSNTELQVARGRGLWVHDPALGL